MDGWGDGRRKEERNKEQNERKMMADRHGKRNVGNKAKAEMERERKEENIESRETFAKWKQ